MDDFQTHQSIKWNGDVGTVQYGGGDSSMVVMFYVRPVPNPAKAAETGRPYFDDKVFVRIHPPGERLNIIDREATQQDKQRFGMQWHQFEQNRPQIANGTPIEMLFAATPSVAAALKASGVHTVEQCAELSAHAIETIGMGGQNWVNSAKRYLEVADKGVKGSQLKKALDEKDLQITSLSHKIVLLETELNQLRDKSMQSVTMADVQQMISNQGGAQGKRPTFPTDQRHLSKPFDAQTAQINDTHATRDISKRKGAPVKRARARIS